MAEPERRRRRLRASSSSATADSDKTEAGPAEDGPADAAPAEDGSAEAAPAADGSAEAGPVEVGSAGAGPVEVGPIEAPKPGPPAIAKPVPADLTRTGPAQPDSDEPTAETAAIVDGPGEPAGARVPRRSRPTSGAPLDDREAERGLRGLVGSGSSQVSVGAALRARDAARPTDAQVADAEQNLPIVRRNWTPREDLPRNR